jgi:hypothetical protein
MFLSYYRVLEAGDEQAKQRGVTLGEQRRRNGCLWCGCLSAVGAIVVVLLAVGGVIAWYSNLPERLGVRTSPAQRLLSGPPDRQAAQQIMDDLADAGMDTRGTWVYVLPVEGKPYRVAYAVLDAAEGFRFGHGGEGDVVLDYLVQLAGGESIDALDIGRVGIDYRDEEGNPVIALTAPTAVIQAYARGEIPPEALMASLEGKLDPEALTGRIGE